MNSLKGCVAVVGGSSRGAGRGIALALGERGATVYLAARTSPTQKREEGAAPGTVEDTAEQVNARGCAGIPVSADLGNPRQTSALFERVEREQGGRLDIVANSVWTANFMAVWNKKPWE